MRQADAEMVAIRRDEDLGFVTQASECNRMNDAITIALENVTGAARPCIGLSMEATARLGGLRGDALWKDHGVPSGTI
jgi:hypothetical protein